MSFHKGRTERLIGGAVIPKINAEIRIEDGLIYNWKTNTWDNKLVEPIIISEVEKIYHIKSKNIELIIRGHQDRGLNTKLIKRLGTVNNINLVDNFTDVKNK